MNELQTTTHESYYKDRLMEIQNSQEKTELIKERLPNKIPADRYYTKPVNT